MAAEPAGPQRSQSLGAFLATIRAVRRLTLREVQDATDGSVSNAYLSQLEHGRIGKPSPNILYHLARVYGVEYETLMERAGYLGPTANNELTGHHGRIATFAGEHLTAEEEQALLEYLGFPRSRRG